MPKLKILLLLAISFCAYAALLNGTAGKIGKTILTVEDVRFFDGVLKLRDGVDPTDLEGPALRSLTQKLVFEEMVLAEMKTLQVERSPKTVVEAQAKAIRSKVGDITWKNFLTRYRKTELHVVEALHRNVDVEKFLEKKVETLTPVVTESEAERYFKQNPTKFYGNTFESIKATVIRVVQKQEMEKGLSEWVRLLREKHHAMNLLDK